MEESILQNVIKKKAPTVGPNGQPRAETLMGVEKSQL
jgi:hypothetical protein